MPFHTRGIPCLLAGMFLCSCDKQDKVPASETEIEAEASSASPGDAVLAKLDSMIIPVINFKDANVWEAIDYLRIRSTELDPYPDPSMRGISIMVIRDETMPENPGGLDASSQDAGNPVLRRISSYQAKDVSLLQALSDICQLTDLDAYLTSHGIVVFPEGSDPVPLSKSDSAEVWKHLTP